MKTRKLNRWSKDESRESADSRSSGPVSSVSAFPLAAFPLTGFSLLELIGVLAVLAILASLLVPVFVRRIDQAARVRDAAELSGMATALRSYILRTGQIPDQTTLVSALANEMAVSATQIATNSRNFQRAFLVDPAAWIASGLPYSQSSVTNGTGTNDANSVAIPGLNLRMMVLSSLALPPLPATIDFNDAWGTPDGSIPSTWTWSGRPDDLKIQRMDITSLFKRVILNPIDTNYFGSFAIESGGQVLFTNPVTQVLSNSWYLQGTALRLYDMNNPPGMQMKAVVQSDTSYVFENGVWRGQLSGWGTNGPIPSPFAPADSFTILSANLSLAANNTNFIHSGAESPLAILAYFYTFMKDYNSWAPTFAPASAATVQGDANAVTNITPDMSR